MTIIATSTAEWLQWSGYIYGKIEQMRLGCRNPWKCQGSVVCTVAGCVDFGKKRFQDDVVRQVEEANG